MAGDGETESSVQKRYLTACLFALQDAKTDTEKFAALLVVTKAVKVQDCTANDKRQILDAVGFAFLIRLFRTKEGPAGCSPLLFRSVAVSVLSALMEDPGVAFDKQMSLAAPYLKEILETALIKKHEEERELLQGMVGDTFSILSRMACTPEGSQMLMDLEYPGMLVQILDNKPDEKTFVMTQTLLILLQRQFGSEVWSKTKGSFDQYLGVLGRCISMCEDKSVFSMCELTTYMLNYTPENGKSKTSAMSLRPLVEKLSTMIKSRLEVTQRQTVLALLNQVVVCLGVECLLPPTLADHKLFLLVLHLTCVEVRMAVENVTEDQVKASRSRLCLHYNTLEAMLTFLCQHDEVQGLPLEADMFCQAHDALLEAAQGIFFFLQQVDSGALSIPLLDPVIVASVRMIAAITSEAFSEVKEGIADVLPFLVKLCKTEVSTMSTLARETAAKGHTVVKNVPVTNKRVVQSIEPPTDHVTNTGASTALQNRQSCTHVSHRLEELQINSDSSLQAIGKVSFPGAHNNESLDSQDRCEACFSEKLADTHDVPEVCVTEESSRCVNKVTSIDQSRGGKTEQQSSGRPVQGVEYERDVVDRERESQAVSDRRHVTSEGETVPRTLEELLTWTCSKTDGVDIQLTSLEVIRFLLPVFQLVCEEEDTRGKFVELSGHTVLVQFLLLRQPAVRTMQDSSCVQEQMMDCRVLEVLVQLLTGDEKLGQSESFTNLLDTALATVPQLDDIAVFHVYKASWIVMGLSLLPMGASQSEKCKQDRVRVFLRHAITFVCQAPVSALRTDVAEGETSAHNWHDVQDMWTLALEDLPALLAHFPELTDMFLQLGFMQTAAMLLQTSQVRIMKTENKPVVENFLKTLAQRSEQAKEQLKQIEGIELTR